MKRVISLDISVDNWGEARTALLGALHPDRHPTSSEAFSLLFKSVSEQFDNPKPSGPSGSGKGSMPFDSGAVRTAAHAFIDSLLRGQD